MDLRQSKIGIIFFLLKLEELIKFMNLIKVMVVVVI
jgi:hypothetical protein